MKILFLLILIVLLATKVNANNTSKKIQEQYLKSCQTHWTKENCYISPKIINFKFVKRNH